MAIRNRFVRTVATIVLAPIFAGCATNPVGGDGSRTVWDSGELQFQIGDKNKNKRKLVMRVWHYTSLRNDRSTDWVIRYSLKAENHDLVGSGWHRVEELSSFTFNAVVDFGFPEGVVRIDKSLDLTGASSRDEIIYSRNIKPFPSSFPPNFISKTATGTRFGGPSGLSKTWP